MTEKHTGHVVKGALILTVAGIISKVLSASYRVPLQNLTGDIGFYTYQQIYPILGIALMMALYGFPSAISIARAQMDLRRQPVTIQTFILPIVLIVLLICSAFFLPLFFYNSEIAQWIGDERLAGPYRAAAFVFLLIPFTSIFRGYFQGNNVMHPTAYSQIGEQVVRVVIIVIGAYATYVGTIQLHAIGYVAVLATVCGSFTAIIIGLLYFRKESFPKKHYKHRIQWGFYFKTIVLFGLVASLNHMMLLVLQLVDTLTLVPQLEHYGMESSQAMQMKGVFDRGQPLIQFGTVLGSSFALALLPAMSTATWKKRTSEIHENISTAYACSMYIAAGATAGLFILFPQINTLLFTDANGTAALRILVLSIVLSSSAITLMAMLQGAGKMIETALAIGAVCGLKWVLNMLFVPLWGISGSAWATVGSLLILFIYLLVRMRKTYGTVVVMRMSKWCGMLYAVVLMGVYLYIAQYAFSYVHDPSRFTLLIYVAFVVSTGAMIYLWACIRLNLLTKEMIELFPGSKWIQNIYKL